ncbi:MAG TPA: 16S rRNA (cytosine(1402)-N(4))-methyltransferase RsmH [Actinomycetota bacterium]|nr:16S rRNA (cytosine(1402)-N(4))-methyltransferase RsmH [Actinomycetota bacterium]
MNEREGGGAAPEPRAEGFLHVPVLSGAAREWLAPALIGGGPLVDCTLGAGGHSEAFLREVPDLVVIGIDRDGQALAAAAARLKHFGERVRLVKANFADIDSVVEEEGYEQVAAVLYDLGVSSPQLDRADRGFGYRRGFALDMRMDQDQDLTARDIVNTYSESRLADILFRYGDERFSRRIARSIVQRREKKPFEDAGDLAEVVRAAIPAATRRTGPHPARRTFQALRIETNRELESLELSLDRALELLRPGGRVAVISYHSLEDRIVKSKFREAAQGCTCPKDFPVCVCGRKPQLRILTSRPVRPSEAESEANPRSDSARMRVAEKLEAA